MEMEMEMDNGDEDGDGDRDGDGVDGGDCDDDCFYLRCVTFQESFSERTRKRQLIGICFVSIPIPIPIPITDPHRLITRLGVVGWVRNTSKGTVEGEAEGPPEAVDQMYDDHYHRHLHHYQLPASPSPSSQEDVAQHSGIKKVPHR